MASGKQTPRQAMINMMYLVLTALLALNVSKEILDSFVTVNNGLENTKLSLNDKMNAQYTSFQNLAAENQAKYGAAWSAAQKIQASGRDLVAYIDTIKARAIITATAMFSTMSGGAVSVPMPMRIPMRRSLAKDRSISPVRARTSGRSRAAPAASRPKRPPRKA